MTLLLIIIGICAVELAIFAWGSRERRRVAFVSAVLTTAATRPVFLVTGSRDFRDAEKVNDALDLAHAFNRNMRLVHGGAAGADRLAHDWAKAHDVPVASFVPDYTRPSPQRYHERNDRMLDLADQVIAFWDGESRGTKSVIEKAKDRGLRVQVVR